MTTRHQFDHLDEIRLRLSDAADIEREQRMRSKTVILDQDGTELISVGPTPQQIVDSEQVTLGCSMTGWDFAQLVGPWFLLGLSIGGVIVAVICHYT